MTFQTSVATALPLVAPLQCPDTAAAIVIVAQSLQSDLAQGFQIDALRLRLEMERAFGSPVFPKLRCSDDVPTVDPDRADAGRCFCSD